jgi:prepilin-type N-terminal cleavage/methylation domain-containing protein
MTRASSGFTLAEMLVAMALMLLVVSAIGALAAGTDRLARTQPRVMDAQQRARVVMDAVGRDLQLAGAGLDRVPAQEWTGPLPHSFAAIWPRRVGRLRADDPFTARPDALTLVYVPDSVVQASLASEYIPALGRMTLTPCALGAPCRVARGTSLAVFDSLGRVDVVGVLGGTDGLLDVRPLGTPGGSFAAGAPVAEVVIRSYYFDSATSQLRLYDADGSDQPVVDDVSGLEFEYFGTSDPPRRPQPPGGVANCLYTDSGDLRPASTLGASDEGLAPLPIAALADGPWCGAGGTLFDADLLRIRRVRVTVRLRASTRRDPQPDYRVVMDVSPPNLALVSAAGGGVW